MLKLIIKQANWGILGAIFGFSIGFFVKIYLIDIVGLESWGKYVIAQTFSSFSETILSIGIPLVIIKFMPGFVENNKEKAGRIANIFLKYAIVVGVISLTIVYFTSDIINHYIYNNITGLEWILFIMFIHIPISMLFGVIISLYRSVLKIKEIVIYGTFVAVTLRAILTFIAFQLTNDITVFIFIEVFVQILVLSILLYLFNKNNFNLFIKSDIYEFTDDNKMVSYAKKMFFNSVIAFVSAQSLTVIISFLLPPEEVGAYNILLTLAGLSTFLLINLNKVFAPVISKLFYKQKIDELENIYQKMTFLVNCLTIPLIILIIFFADEILGLYSENMIEYKQFLFFMILGGILSLASGSSGTIMMMTGLEDKLLKIQIFRSIIIIVLSLVLIPYYGMLSVVCIYCFVMLFTNISHLFYIKSVINISPFTFDLLKLFMISFIILFLAINQNYKFNLIHFITIPVLTYIFYFLIMFKSIKRIIKQLI